MLNEGYKLCPFAYERPSPSYLCEIKHLPYINAKSVKPDIIPEDETEFRLYMFNKFGTTFDN